ncbi:hypothetical protein [Lederbergia panacisoli]|uniref:hypothetical protein n=1 Tax=Lederbergia panacisoli TaxID=1255251 RepID=UPI00214AEA6E|nr:hypothetical protein [Lederbergia panacisoli]MCR2820590.1 hypothetical protein [Lederbergia panacisoli]
MECTACKIKESIPYCLQRNSNGAFCIDCCKKLRSWDLCDTNCVNFPKEASHAPLIKGLELTRVYDGHTHKFVEDMFLPNIFNQLYCEVSLCQVNVFEPNHIEVDLIFKIKEFTKVNKEEYLKDEWKIAENGDNLRGLVPILQIYTFEHGSSNVIHNSFSIDNHPFMRYDISSYHFRTWQPFSFAKNDYINVKEKEEFQEDVIIGRVVEGEGFFGKNDTIWTELIINKDYKLTLNISYSNLIIDRKKQQVKIPFGLYFPFKLVNYLDYKLILWDDLIVEEDSKYTLIIPKKMRDEQLFVIPLESNMNFIEGGGYYENDLLGVDSKFHYDRYCIFHHNLILKVDNGFVVNSKVSKFPLMTGLYKSMKRLYEGKYAPAYVNLINSSNKVRKVKLIAKIQGLSKKYELNLNLRPHEYKCLPILPTLDDKKIVEINEITTESLEINIYENHNRVYSETHEIIVHPVESFIYNFQDRGYSFKTYLYQLLACYCTPHTREIERIISEASKLVGNIMGTLSNNFDKIMKELEAIYNVLSKDMSYVTRSFNFSLENMNDTQRVSLPSTTLRLKSGNCIDLSLLLASTYEACKHEVELVLIPGHAFLAVNVTSMWIYIEATCLGNSDFKKAIEVGTSQFEKYFSMNNQPKDSNSRRVSIKLARENGILPFE